VTHVLLGQSYFLRFDPKLLAAMQPYPPLGTLYAAAYLRRRGHEVALFDAMLAGSENEWAAALDRQQPQVAVLYEDNFNYLSKMCLLRMRDAALRMITLARDRGCTVILCGADASDRPEIYLAHGADYVIQGEGEETLSRLLDVMEGRQQEPVDSITGLVWRDPSGSVRRNPPGPGIADLDELVFPAWDLVDVSQYRQRWTARHGYFSMNMVTTRGCPYGCNWCAKPIWGRRYSARTPANVVAELEWLKESYRPDHIWFADDIFGLTPGWIESFGGLARERNAAVPFKCQMRADLVTPPVAEGLRSARCDTVWLGAESGSQKVLDAMEKGMTVGHIRQARRLLGDAGIKVGFFIQFGYPGETRADIRMTLDLIRDLAPDDIGISVSYPLPGTGFYERVRAQLGEKQNWTDSDDLAMLYRGPFPEAFYHALYRAVHAEFRMRKAIRLLKQSDMPRQAWRAKDLRAIASIPKHWMIWHRQRRQLNRYREIPDETQDRPLQSEK